MVTPQIAPKKKYKLSNILELRHYMKIVIDDYVEVDENGNFIINIGYLRVSTDRQADFGYGLDIQEESITNYCRLNKYPNLVLFIDDGYTGTDFEKRPALNGVTDLIKGFNAGKSNIKIGTMIIPRIDRLGRTLLGTLQFIQDYIVSAKDSKNSTINTNKEDINFVSVQENYCRIDKENPQGKFLLMLFATLAEYDRDMIVKKLKDGRTARVASGKWIGGGNVPYGYRYDKELGKLLIVPEEAEKIREIFRLYVEEKVSPQKIADRLGFKGDKIITNILKRKSLTGCILYNGEEYKGEHEAIISLAEWEEAQDEIEKRSVHRADSSYLLSGLVHCGECGAKMRYQKWNKHGACKLVCYSTQKSAKKALVKKEDCDNERFWAYEIEDAVIAELFRMTYLGNEDRKKAVSFFDPTESLMRELKELKKELKELRKLYLNDGKDPQGRQIADVEELAEELADGMVKQRAIEFQLNSEEEKKRIARKIEKAKNIFRNLDSAWAHMTDEEKQAVCQELIDRVEIFKDGTVDVHLKLRSYLASK